MDAKYDMTFCKNCRMNGSSQRPSGVKMAFSNKAQSVLEFLKQNSAFDTEEQEEQATILIEDQNARLTSQSNTPSPNPQPIAIEQKNLNRSLQIKHGEVSWQSEQSRYTFKLPNYSETVLKSYLRTITMLRERQQTAQITTKNFGATATQLTKELLRLGIYLGNTFIPPKLNQLITSDLQTATSKNCMVKLTIECIPELQNLPWEMISLPGTDKLLMHTPNITITRRQHLSRPAQADEKHSESRIIIFIANPMEGFKPRSERVIEQIDTVHALRNAKNRNLQVSMLDLGSLQKITRELAQQQWETINIQKDKTIQSGGVFDNLVALVIAYTPRAEIKKDKNLVRVFRILRNSRIDGLIAVPKTPKASTSLDHPLSGWMQTIASQRVDKTDDNNPVPNQKLNRSTTAMSYRAPIYNEETALNDEFEVYGLDEDDMTERTPALI